MPLLTPVHEGSGFNLRTDLLQDEAIVVDSDTFVEKIIVDNREYARTVYHINNDGVTNSLDYEIFAHADKNDGVPPTFDNSWEELKAATALLQDSSTVETLTDRYAWVQINIRRTAAGQSTTAKIWINAHGD